MSTLAESLIRRKSSQDLDTLSVDKLPGGISNEIYKVDGYKTANGESFPITITVFREPREWWKIDKEKAVRRIIGNDPEVLIPKLVDSGFDMIDGNKIGFLICELVEGEDIDSFLEKKLTLSSEKEKLAGLAKDLGSRLGILHGYSVDTYGLIGFAPEQYESWQRYVLQKFDKETELFNKFDPKLQAGLVRVGNLQNLLGPLREVVERLQGSLVSPEIKISHGDSRFGNFIVNANEFGEWKLTGMIDLDSMLGGDPEIDIAFIENWLHFSSYKEAFLEVKDSFVNGYSKMHTPSLSYQEKRFIYHAIRSLEYLRTIFGSDVTRFIELDPPKHIKYLEQHMQIIQSLSRGNYLEDVGIHSLL